MLSFVFLALLGVGLLILLVLIFEIWMFVDAVKNPRLTDTERLIWCVAMLFIHPFIAIAYYFVAHSKQDKI